MSDWKKKLDDGEGKRLDKILTKEEDRRTARLPKILSKSSTEDLTTSTTGASGDIESTEYLETRLDSIKRFVPAVDFSDPKNFAKFGSAKQYYEDSIRRIYETYPYDGSGFEKEQWALSSSYFDLYLFDSEYPKTTGHVKFSPSGWGTLAQDKAPAPTTVITITSEMGLGLGTVSAGETLAISDGSTTVTWTLVDTSSGSSPYDAASATQLGMGSDRPIEFFTAELASKINSSALNITATAGSTTVTMTHDGGGTITVTEDAANNGIFGSSASILTTAPGNTSSYGLSNQVEYIYFEGGPNKDNIYDPVKNRISNLRIDGQSGNTVEFWLKKDAFVASAKTDREVIFDAWTLDYVSGSTDAKTHGNSHARFRIELDSEVSSGSPWRVTYISGSDNGFVDHLIGDTTKSSVADGKWHHYAFSLLHTSSSLACSMYVDGQLNDHKEVTVSNFGSVDTNIVATIGALGTKKSVTGTATLGWGKLSGSIDEFRFWKKNRTPKDIGRNWFLPINGGTNTFLKNPADLGVYYKFNEGITLTSSVDSKILDYSGRITNGLFVGYGDNSRSTVSAITESGNGTEERDPIIYWFHPDVISLNKDKKEIGESYDYTNNASIFNTIPNWIVNDDLKKDRSLVRELTQVVSSYFDTAYLQAEALPTLKDVEYRDFSNKSHTSGSKPLPFTNKLLESYSFMTPELFADAQVLELISNRDESRAFEEEISDVKNFIYKNIYNNLVNIYKAKGTEKSFRNFIRCFGIDEEVVKLNTYANNYTYEIKENLRYTTSKTNAVNFYNTSSFGATIYQATSSLAGSKNYVPGSTSTKSTFEADVFVPKHAEENSRHFFDVSFITASVFGCHTPASFNTADTSWATSDVANFSVDVIRSAKNEAYFRLKSSNNRIPELTSSVFPILEGDRRWNLAVRIAHQSRPFGNLVSGAADSPYDVIFSGLSYISDEIEDEFLVSGSMTKAHGDEFHQTSKRLYAGAHRTNFTGSLINQTDLKIASIRYWQDFLDDEDLKTHAIDPENFGRAKPQHSSVLFEKDHAVVEVPSIKTLALHWGFSNLTGSDEAGTLHIQDLSSGSYSPRYGALDSALTSRYPGFAYGFDKNDKTTIAVKIEPTARPHMPENVYSSDMVQILDTDPELFTRNSRPTDFYFMFEKSMYQTISEEMVKFFSTVTEFNNLIGEPVNRYRQKYKSLEKLRALFYESVENTPDIDKYIEYYKWIDLSMSKMIDQLKPIAFDFSEDINTMVESHVLERSKYWTKYPTLEMNSNEPFPPILGINELLYDWEHGHAPIDKTKENENCFWWKSRAGRDDSNLLLSSSAGAASSDKEKIRRVQNSEVSGSTYVLRKLSKPYRLTVDRLQTINSGHNARANKNRQFYKGALAISENSSMTLLSASIEEITDCIDVFGPSQKETIHGKVDTEGTSGYLDADAVMSLPFSLFSSSAETGYISGSGLSGVKPGLSISNLHDESYGIDSLVPLQSGFTSAHVGGMPHRHAPIRTKFTSTTTSEGIYGPYSQEALQFAGTNSNKEYMYSNGLMSFYGNLLGSGIKADDVSFFVWLKIPAVSTFSVADSTYPSSDDDVSDADRHRWHSIFSVTSPLDGTASDRTRLNNLRSAMFFGIAGHPNLEKNDGSTISAGNLVLDASSETSHHDWVDTGIKIDDDDWHHVGFTYDLSEDTFKIYVDNVLVATKDYGNTGSDRWNATSDSTHAVWAAAYYVDSDSSTALYDNFLHATLSNMTIWTQVLDASHVSELYNNGVPGNANAHSLASSNSKLRVWYSMDKTVTHAKQEDISAHTGTGWGDKDASLILSPGDSYTSHYVAISQGTSTTTETGFENRPEAYKIEIQQKTPSVDGKLEVKSVDTGNPASVFYRDGLAKRPVNISNIQHTTASMVLGNYNNSYEIVQTMGKTSNLGEFIKEGGYTLEASQTLSSNTFTMVDTDVRFTGSSDNRHIFAARFSALGGPTSRNEVNLESGEYSPYSTINYKNLKARNLLGVLHGEYSAQFGARSGSVIVSGEGTGADYELTSSIAVDTSAYLDKLRPTVAASIHKTQRNTRYLMEQTGTLDINGYEINHDGKPIVKYDSFLVQRPIPQSALQYTWIANSTTESTGSFLGYQHDYTIPSVDGSSSYQAEIQFLQTSQNNTENDFVGLNTVVNSVVTASENLLSSHDFTSATGLNDVILNRQGPYGWPSWKQLRGSEHPVTRYNKNNNVFSFHLRGETMNTSPIQMMAHYSADILNTGYASAGEMPAVDLINDTPKTVDRKIRNIVDSPITSKHKPLKFGYGPRNAAYINMNDPDVQNVNTTKYSRLFKDHWLSGRSETIVACYGNSICYFSNKNLEYFFEQANLIPERADRLNKAQNIIDTIVKNPGNYPLMMSYSEIVFPRAEYSHTKFARVRSNFVNNFWRDERSERNLVLTGSVSYSRYTNADGENVLNESITKNIVDSFRQEQRHVNSLGIDVVDDTFHNKIHITQSIWPLDSRIRGYELSNDVLKLVEWSNYAMAMHQYGELLDPTFTYLHSTDQRTRIYDDNGFVTSPSLYFPVNVGTSYTSMYANWSDMYPTDWNKSAGPSPGFTDFTGDSVYPNGTNMQGRLGEGELQNDYSIFHLGHNSVHISPPAALVYNRRVPQSVIWYQHSYTQTTTMLNTAGPTKDISNARGQIQVLSGDAPWLAAEQAGKYPFVKSYDEWREETRIVGQDYSLVPEFKISDHIHNLIKMSQSVFTRPRGSTLDEPIQDLLSVTGAVFPNSMDKNFAKTYSTSDMMKYFDFALDNANSIGLPASRITMKCEAITKILPYDGFYPVLRTTQIGRIFADNYLESGFGISSYPPGPPEHNNLIDKKISGSLSQIIKPFMAPGVLYNSIKSGLAVDYPIFKNEGSGSMEVATRKVDDPLELMLMGVSGSLTAGPHWKTYGSELRKARSVVEFNRSTPNALAGATLTLTHPVSGSKVFTIGSLGSTTSGLTVGLTDGDSSATARNLITAINNASNWSSYVSSSTHLPYVAELHPKNSSSVLIRSYGGETHHGPNWNDGTSDSVVLSDNSSWTLKENFNTPWFNMPDGGTRYGLGVTGSFFNGTLDNSIPRISGAVDARVSFESFMFPDSLVGQKFWDNEPHPSASMLYGGYEQWRTLDMPPIFGEINPESERKIGVSATKYQDMTAYSLAANNFVAESVNLFLEDGKLTTIMSSPDSLWRAPASVLNGEGFIEEKEFRMRFYLVNSNTMMYDRKSAFGPPVDALYKPRSESVTVPGKRAVSFVSIVGTPTANYPSSADQFIAVTSSDGVVHKIAFTTSATADDTSTAGTAADPKMYYVQLGGDTGIDVNSTTYTNKAAFASALGDKLRSSGICHARKPVYSVGSMELLVLAQLGTGSAGNTTIPYPSGLMTGSGGSVTVFKHDSNYNSSYATSRGFGDPIGAKFLLGEDQQTLVQSNSKLSHSFDPYVPQFLDQAKSSDLESLEEDLVIDAPYVEFCLRVNKDSYTLDELFSNLETTSSIPLRFRKSTAHDSVMSLSASFNFLASVVEPVTERGSEGEITSQSQPTNVEANKRWAIYPKWETPVLDFQEAEQSQLTVARWWSEDIYHPISADGRISSNTLGQYFQARQGLAQNTGSTILYDGRRPHEGWLTSSKGMWHQYGKYPKSGQGYFGIIKDVKGYPSLADMVGFKKDQPTQYGKVKESTKVSEAVVAIPFTLMDPSDSSTGNTNKIKFFDIAYSTRQLREILQNAPDSISSDIKHQMNMMERFVFPPQFDFITNPDKVPIVMFVFPFSVDLDREDLVDMWQNLPPKAALHAKSQEARYVSHDLKLPRSINLDKDVMWKVFKVKQRASHLYTDKVADSLISGDGKFKSSMIGKSQQTDLVGNMSALENFVKTKGSGYNWPYDFFSLIELIKLENKVDFENNVVSEREEATLPQGAQDFITTQDDPFSGQD